MMSLMMAIWPYVLHHRSLSLTEESFIHGNNENRKENHHPVWYTNIKIIHRSTIIRKTNTFMVGLYEN